MPINESKGRRERERWPLAFDLEGIPRDTRTRQQLLEEIREPNPQFLENEPMDVPRVKNTFAGENDPLLAALSPEQKQTLLRALLADANNTAGKSFDLSKPPVEPYVFREFPKCMYSRDGKQIINARDAEHEKELAKKGFLTKPPVKKQEDETAA